MASVVCYPAGPAVCPKRCYLPPADGVVVPIKEEVFGFRRLLYDRLRAYMVMELVHLREGMMGSDALINRCLKEAPLNTQLKLIVGEGRMREAIRDDITMKLLLETLYGYVTNAAWGDAAQRMAGHLEPVRTFAPGEILLGCCCEGKVFTQQAIMAALKTTHKPDWSKYLDWAESMREQGKAMLEPRALLRKRLQLSLEKLYDDFLDVMDEAFNRDGFPMHDVHMLNEEIEVRKLVEKVKPLPAHLVEGLDKMDPYGYTIQQLEALRLCGYAVHESVARLRREEGNPLWARANALSGIEGQKALAQAQAKWMSTLPSGGFECIASSGNLAALMLKQKNYESTIVFASNVPTRFSDMFFEPKDYEAFRTRCIESFLKADVVKLPNNKLRRVTDAEEKAMFTIMFKSLCREGKAHMALCQAAMAGHGKMSAANAEKAKMHRDKAVECYQKMQSIPGTPDVPMAELDALHRAYNARMGAHDRGRSSTR